MHRVAYAQRALLEHFTGPEATLAGDKSGSQTRPPELRQPTENAVGPMPTPDPVIKRQPHSKTGWSRPGKIILSRRFSPFGSDRSLEPTTEKPMRRNHPGNPEDGQVIYCSNESAHALEEQNPGCAALSAPAPPSAHRRPPACPAELSGFAPPPKQDALETGSPDIEMMNKCEPSLVP